MSAFSYPFFLDAFFQKGPRTKNYRKVQNCRHAQLQVHYASLRAHKKNKKKIKSQECISLQSIATKKSSNSKGA